MTIQFTGSESGSTRLTLPEDLYGTPAIWRFVVDLEVEGAVVSERSKDAPSVVLGHEPGSAIRFTYLLSFDPEKHEDLAYRPSVGLGHFHFFGPQWLVRFPDRHDLQQSYRFAFKKVPEAWSVFSNLGAGTGPWEFESSEDMISGFIAGGDYVSSRGDAVEVHIRGSFDDPERIAASVQAIVDGQYTNRHERLNYVRGPLMALTWDRQLELDGETTVLELVRAFVREGEQNGGEVSEEAFFAMFEDAGIDAWDDYERYIVDGEVPVPPADALGSGFKREPETVTTSTGQKISSWRFVPTGR